MCIKNGVFQAPLQILHAGDTLYEINASFTDRQDDDEVLRYFTRLFDYLLSEKVVSNVLLCRWVRS